MISGDSIDKKKYSNFNNFNNEDYYANKDNYFSNDNEEDDQFDYDMLANSINAMVINNIILNNNTNNNLNTNISSNKAKKLNPGSNKFFNPADAISHKLNRTIFSTKTQSQNNERQNYSSGRNYANKVLNNTGMTSFWV